MSAYDPYEPLNTLKPFAEEVWIVDGPLIRFGMPWPKFSFPTRATVIRLERGLFIHSPTPLTPELGRAITEIGTPRWIIGPNRIHYWWLPDWSAAFPNAQVWLAPRIREQSKGRIDLPAAALEPGGAFPWDGAIDTVCLAGSFMTEFDFFHRASRTLLLTDLMENFEPERVHSAAMRLVLRLAGALAPEGGMPRDMRLAFPKAGIKSAVETMLRWHPERIILAHGRCIERDAEARLRRSFHWLLQS